MVVPIYVSTSRAQAFILLHIFSPLVIFCLSVTSHSNRYEVIFHCGFHFNFPMVSDVECLFMYLLDTCYIFFGEMFIQLLCPLLIRQFVFLPLNYEFWILAPYQIYNLLTFSPIKSIDFFFCGWFPLLGRSVLVRFSLVILLFCLCFQC